jgi:hypothetical protein
LDFWFEKYHLATLVLIQWSPFSFFSIEKSLSLPREDFRDFFVGSEPAIKKHRCQHCHRVLFQLEANFFVTFSPTSS